MQLDVNQFNFQQQFQLTMKTRLDCIKLDCVMSDILLDYIQQFVFFYLSFPQ